MNLLKMFYSKNSLVKVAEKYLYFIIQYQNKIYES